MTKSAPQWTTGKLFIKELDILDCAVYCPSFGLVGETWHVDIEVEGKLDENGFVYDFSHTKKTVKETLKNTLDHALIIPQNNDVLNLTTNGETSVLKLEVGDDQWHYKCPSQAIYQIDTDEINASTVAKAAEQVIIKALPDTVTSIKIVLRNESNEERSGMFQYTHGLPHHKGLCQRLVHGHRSKIIIDTDGTKDTALETLVSENWFESRIHIAEPGQFQSKPWEVYTKGPKGEKATLCYTAQEGYFELTLPAHKVYLVEQATSIESISQGLCKVLKQQYPSKKIRVMAHEGINKGGIAEA